MDRKRTSRLPRRDDEGWDEDLGGWEPRPRRAPRPFWASAWLAGLLAAVLVALVAAAVLLSGGLPAFPPLSGGRPSPTAGRSAPPASPTPLPSPTFVRPTPTPMPTFLAYAVRPGDSLNAIAKRFETTARSIAFWNRGTYPSLDPLSDGYQPNRIEVGWTLRLIPGVEVDEEELLAPSPTG